MKTKKQLTQELALAEFKRKTQDLQIDIIRYFAGIPVVVSFDSEDDDLFTVEGGGQCIFFYPDDHYFSGYGEFNEYELSQLEAIGEKHRISFEDASADFQEFRLTALGEKCSNPRLFVKFDVVTRSLAAQKAKFQYGQELNNIHKINELTGYCFCDACITEHMEKRPELELDDGISLDDLDFDEDDI